MGKKTASCVLLFALEVGLGLRGTLAQPPPGSSAWHLHAECGHAVLRRRTRGTERQLPEVGCQKHMPLHGRQRSLHNPLASPAFLLQREDMAVDTHVWEITKALGWVPTNASRDQAYDHLNELVPGGCQSVLLLRPPQQVAGQLLDRGTCPTCCCIHRPGSVAPCMCSWCHRAVAPL